jgi:hypothetical protein
MKYVLCNSQGGINDQFVRIQMCLNYCNKYGRVLLINMTKSRMNINFSDYFYFDNTVKNYIGDIKQINNILSNKNLTIFPTILQNSKINYESEYTSNGFIMVGDENKTTIDFNFNLDYNHDVLVYEGCGGGDPLKLFTKIRFKKNLLQDFNNKFSKIPNPYLCIHIRNTDYRCNYKKLYNDNKDFIHSKDNIYIATDDKNSLQFFISKGLNILNFTNFPKEDTYVNLPRSSLPKDVKIKDTISDLCIISLSDNLLSNSKGGFIALSRKLHKNKNIINNILSNI